MTTETLFVNDCNFMREVAGGSVFVIGYQVVKESPRRSTDSKDQEQEHSDELLYGQVLSQLLFVISVAKVDKKMNKQTALKRPVTGLHMKAALIHPD